MTKHRDPRIGRRIDVVFCDEDGTAQKVETVTVLDEKPFAWAPFARDVLQTGGDIVRVADAAEGYAVFVASVPIGGGWDDGYYLVEEHQEDPVGTALERIAQAGERLQHALRAAQVDGS